MSVAFGLKPAPAYVSIVSAELARILQSFGVKVTGVYIDDFLVGGKTKEECERGKRIAIEVCAALGTPIAEEKTQGPCPPGSDVQYLGVSINSAICTMTVTDEHRFFAIHQIDDVVQRKKMTLEEAESLCGTLTWICIVRSG